MVEVLQALALIVAAAFAAVALYVNIAEHPARMTLDDAGALGQWKPAYKKGALMQASLAILGFLFGAGAGWLTQDWRWWGGGIAILVNWPYTLLIILPVNNNLLAMTGPTPETRPLLQRWNALHAGRTALGFLSLGLFLWATLT